MDLANLIFAALVVGQVMAQRIDQLVLLIGFVSYIILSVLAYIFEIERKKQ